MNDFVESFREVEENSVYLPGLVKIFRQVTESVGQLGFTATALAKTVLKIRKDVIVVKKV